MADNSIRALIVDDEEPLRGIMKIALGYFGIKVVGEAANGEEAVTRYQEVHPNVVLMDINMPKMDGLTALREIRKINPDAIVLLITATDDETAMDRGRELGARGFLRKPLVMDELHKDILSHLRVQIAKEKGQTLEADYYKYQIKPGFRPGDEGKHFEAPQMTGATKVIRERQKAHETPETHPTFHEDPPAANAAPAHGHDHAHDHGAAGLSHPHTHPHAAAPQQTVTSPAEPVAPSAPRAADHPAPAGSPPSSGGRAKSRVSAEVADILGREGARHSTELEAARAEVQRLKKALADAAEKLRQVAEELARAAK